MTLSIKLLCRWNYFVDETTLSMKRLFSVSINWLSMKFPRAVIIVHPKMHFMFLPNEGEKLKFSINLHFKFWTLIFP